MTKAVRWSEEQFADHRKKLGNLADNSRGIVTVKAPPKRSKYASQKVEQDGVTFDSRKEARRWAELEAMERAGQITELRRQVAFELAPAVHLVGEKRKKPAMRYFSDFCYLENGILMIEDCKSTPTRRLPAYRMKRHLLATVLGLQIKEV